MNKKGKNDEASSFRANLSITMKKYISNSPHGIMFHYFHDEKHLPFGQGSMHAIEFEKILNYIGIENILSPEEWLFKLRNNKLRNNDVCITFDDGLRCQYDICLSVLVKYDVRAFWFVYSSVFEGKVGKLEVYKCFIMCSFPTIDEFYRLFFRKYKEGGYKETNGTQFESYCKERKSAFPFYSLNDLQFRFMRDEILDKNAFEELMDNIMQERGIKLSDISKDLWLTDLHLKTLSEKGHCIGLHSYDHPLQLSKLPYKEQLNQYMKNYDHIKKVCNTKVISMSHPLNSYNKNTLKILTHIGILCGFRSNMLPPNGKKINPGYLEMAREDSANILKVISNTNEKDS